MFITTWLYNTRDYIMGGCTRLIRLSTDSLLGGCTRLIRLLIPLSIGLITYQLVRFLLNRLLIPNTRLIDAPITPRQWSSDPPITPRQWSSDPPITRPIIPLPNRRPILLLSNWKMVRLNKAVNRIIQKKNPRVGTSRFVSKGEQICRIVLEMIFKVPFPSSRPLWLINPNTGSPMELDCYNEDLKLAVEYNGIQHYEYNESFHSSPDKYVESQYRDKQKKTLCKQQGVFLIVVSYLIALDRIPYYLIRRIKENYQLS
jgi:hypothetical protein